MKYKMKTFRITYSATNKAPQMLYKNLYSPERKENKFINNMIQYYKYE